VVVLEELQHAIRRQAMMYAEVRKLVRVQVTLTSFQSHQSDRVNDFSMGGVKKKSCNICSHGEQVTTTTTGGSP